MRVALQTVSSVVDKPKRARIGAIDCAVTRQDRERHSGIGSALTCSAWLLATEVVGH